jgi:hypothetical protein
MLILLFLKKKVIAINGKIRLKENKKKEKYNK